MNVRIHGTLKDAARNSRDRIQLADGATVADLLEALGLGCRAPALVIADGRTVSPSDNLHDGAQVSIFALVSGG